MGENKLNLPPGFRFYPTDEELLVHFLQRKAALLPCHPDVIPDLDLYPYDPWDLDGKAMCEGKTWYYYSRRTSNRISESGYWQSIGVEDPIYSSTAGGGRKLIGIKKYSAFYMNDQAQPQPQGGLKTNWIMHEYKVSNSSSSSRKNNNIDHSKWVLCRVYEHHDDDDHDGGTELSCLDEVFLSLDDFDEISLPN